MLSHTGERFADAADEAPPRTWSHALPKLLRKPSVRSLLRVAAWLSFAVLAARLALDAGVTWDEEVQREYGDRILAWFRSGFHDRSATDFKNLYFYGGLF